MSSKWRPKITTISETNDLNTLNLEELISSLRSHEIELAGDEPKKKQPPLVFESKQKMVLQATTELEDNDSDDQNMNSQDEELAFISKKIQKRKDEKSDKKNIKYYTCNELGHVKSK